MKIPEYRDRIREQVVHPYPAGAEIAESIAGVTAKAAQVAKELDDDIKFKRDQDEFINAQLGTLEVINTMKLEYENDPDYTTQVDRFQKDKNEVLQHFTKKIKSKRILEEYHNWFREKSLAWDYDVKNQAIDLEIKHAQVNARDELDRAAALGDKDLLHETIARLVASKVYFSHQAAVLENDYMHRIDVDSALREAKSKGYAAGIPWVNSTEARHKYKGVTTDEWDGIERELKSDQGLEEERIRKEEEAKQKKLYDSAFQDFLSGSLRMEDFRPAGKYVEMETTKKEHWTNLLEQRAKAAKEEREKKIPNRFEITNPEVEAQLYVMWDDPTVKDEKVEKFLDDHHGKGLSTKDCQKYDNDLKKRSPDLMRQYSMQLIESSFVDQIRTEAGNTQYITQLFSEQALVMKTYAAWYEANKDQPDEVKAKKASDLVMPFREYWTNRRLKGIQEQRRKIQAEVGGAAGAPTPALKEDEFIIKDPKTGKRYIFSTLTGSKREIR